jgi:hypothetical protein
MNLHHWLSELWGSLGTMLGIEGLAFMGLSIHKVSAQIWTVWMGIVPARKSVQIQTL